MTETPFARSRSVSLGGLLLQAVCTAACAALAVSTPSRGLAELAWFMAAGVLVWFITLLVHRQHELAALEAMDLEELRREKQAVGSELLFSGEGGVSSGMRVAQQRLEWMQSFLVPAFGLIIGAFLLCVGLWRFALIRPLTLSSPDWPVPQRLDLALIVLSILMLALFFLARYASGMGRVTNWQMLRACGSLTLANSIAAMALVVGFGVQLYQGTAAWEHVVAWVIPILLIVLGLETLANFLLDFYRPRVPGTERRASFDSRLLGMISEPGGIAGNLAEAINYQFGFRVSQTWFYLLLQRTLVPLIGVGVLAIWLLTCLVVVWPHERAIIERFGRQIDPERPLTPGLHFKWPAPVERARKYNVDRLEQFFVGYKLGDQPLAPKDAHASAVELWTDLQHSGRDHFDFIIPPTPAEERERGPASAPAEAPPVAAGDGVQRAPVHLVRMELFVQYRIRPDRLIDYTRSFMEPEAALRAVAWSVLSRVAASAHIDVLVGAAQAEISGRLRKRLNDFCDTNRLGIEVVRVGFVTVHPEKSVSESFRKVVTAQLEKLAEIRKARVTENELLSQAAGDRNKALALARAIESAGQAEQTLSRAEGVIRDAKVRLAPAAQSALTGIDKLIAPLVQARFALESARQERESIDIDIELGLGRTVRQRQNAIAAEQQATAAEKAAAEALAGAVGPVREKLSKDYAPTVVTALVDRAIAQATLAFWNRQMESNLIGLEGDAAVVLARAQATRWSQELRAAGEVTLATNERSAYVAAPKIYRARRYLEVLVNGIKDARKYLLFFEPGDRQVRTRIEAQEQARPDLGDTPARVQP